MWRVLPRVVGEFEGCCSALVRGEGRAQAVAVLYPGQTAAFQIYFEGSASRIW